MSRKHRGTRVRLFLKVAAAGVSFALLMTAMLGYQVYASTSRSAPGSRPVTARAARSAVKASAGAVGPSKKPPHRKPKKRRHLTETLAAYRKAEHSTQEAKRARLAAQRRRREVTAARAKAQQTAEVSGPPAPVEVPTPAPVTSEPS